MADIFVSYSRSDRPTLDQLLEQMRNAFPKSTIWFDEQLVGGDEWWQTILDEIEQCRLFLYLISDEATESPYCQDELRHALDLYIPVVPVIVRRLGGEYPGTMPDELATVLREKQYVDLAQGLDGKATSKLWGAMTQQLFATPPPPTLSGSVPINVSVTPHVGSDKSLAPVDDRQIHLTRKDRWFLANQFAILAKLYPDDAEHYEDRRQIVENGYELHYDSITEHIYDGRYTMSRENCLEVLDILAMFSALQSAYEDITDKSGIDSVWISFSGFDGNNETSYMAYTRFMIEREGKFSWLITTNRSSYDRYNSHHPILFRYRAMVEEWKKRRNQYNLTKDDVIRITTVDAKYVPSWQT